jgi:uncharacterized protein YegJ (DUF2314 family)
VGIRKIIFFGIAAFVVWTYTTSSGKRIMLPASAQTTTQKARSDQVFMIKTGDPEMMAARQKARATLPEFLKIASAPRSGMRNFTVKIGIVDGGQHEFFWIAPFKHDGTRFTGQIDNTPRMVKNVTKNQTITFDINDITDWMYVDNGKMKGNFSACVLLKKEPKDQADALKKRFGLECDA